jgi:hypothetical protein
LVYHFIDNPINGQNYGGVFMALEIGSAGIGL